MNGKHSILNTPIEIIATSNEFQEMCKINGFNNLGKIIEFNVNDMLKKPEFNHRMLKELYQILEVHNLTKCIKES